MNPDRADRALRILLGLLVAMMLILGTMLLVFLAPFWWVR